MTDFYNYCKKHLNWTLLFGAMLIESPLMIVVFSFPSDTIASFGFVMLVIGTIFVELCLEFWYLYQKKRSYAFLLLNFVKPFYVPIGTIILLSLDNKREENKVTNSISVETTKNAQQ